MSSVWTDMTSRGQRNTTSLGRTDTVSFETSVIMSSDWRTLCYLDEQILSHVNVSNGGG